ncbi:Lrp/AsnC family transcriptional regulator [Streptomyces sp. NRRL WC-3742]|uniref:Lrp/AsnC family transcriptional regulator n=1 Tax=Streptomyces sp. NRRL WC-3742 TaxID=1463934 RepID=UPI0004C7F805|nr:Lrp/AsnC family transcriptional regulator [Streptomyces sp. NRRL WC-3742]
MDRLDREILHALYVDGRAPFNRVAAVLGVSDRTVARRYRVMRESGVLRVVGGPAPGRFGRTTWVVRLECAPGASVAVAEALGRREDTQWVRIASGGTEVLCTVHGDDADREALLLDRLPATRPVTAISAHCVLRSFKGGGPDWQPVASVLTADQVRALEPPPVVPSVVPSVGALDAIDRILLAELALDGRATPAALARATGRDESTVRRRITALRTSGVLVLDLDVDQRALGLGFTALLWLTVEPAHLTTVCTALASHEETAFTAATTGPTNILASAVTADPDACFTYLTDRIAPLPGIHALRTTPILRTVKRTGPATPR